MTTVGVRIIPEPASQEHRTTRHAICAYFSLQKIIFVVSFRKKSVRGGVAKRTIPLLRQPIVTEVLLPRASIETNKNYGLEVRQQYPGGFHVSFSAPCRATETQCTFFFPCIANYDVYYQVVICFLLKIEVTFSLAF